MCAASPRANSPISSKRLYLNLWAKNDWDIIIWGRNWGDTGKEVMKLIPKLTIICGAWSFWSGWPPGAAAPSSAPSVSPGVATAGSSAAACEREAGRWGISSMRSGYGKIRGRRTDRVSKQYLAFIRVVCYFLIVQVSTIRNLLLFLLGFLIAEC